MKLSIVVAIFCGLGLLLMGSAVLPFPDRDSSWFLGTAMSVASGDGLVNRQEALAIQLDPEGQARFLAFPPAFPLVVGLLGGGSIRGATIVIAALSATAIVLCSVLFGQMPELDRTPARWLAAIAIIGFATAFSNGSQRPEALASVLVLLGALALRRVPDGVRRDLLLGALIGVLVHVQVPVAFYSAALWAALVSAQHASRRAFATLARGAFAAGAVAAVGFWLHPFGAHAYLEAFLTHASLVTNANRNGFLQYWLFGVRFPGLLPTTLLSVTLAIWHRRSARQKPRSPALLALAVISGTALLVRASLFQPARWYDVIAFLPFMYMTILAAVSRASRASGASAASRWLVVASFAVTLVNASGYLRRLAMAIPAFAGASSHAQAAEQLRRDLAELHERGMIATSPEAWMLLPDFRWGCVLSMKERFNGGTTCGVLPRLLVMQQTRLPAGTEAPSRLRIASDLIGRRTAVADSSSWVLVHSRFTSAPYQLPVIDGPWKNGWGYALYRRLPAAPDA